MPVGGLEPWWMGGDWLVHPSAGFGQALLGVAHDLDGLALEAEDLSFTGVGRDVLREELHCHWGECNGTPFGETSQHSL